MARKQKLISSTMVKKLLNSNPGRYACGLLLGRCEQGGHLEPPPTRLLLCSLAEPGAASPAGVPSAPSLDSKGVAARACSRCAGRGLPGAPSRGRGSAAGPASAAAERRTVTRGTAADAATDSLQLPPRLGVSDRGAHSPHELPRAGGYLFCVKCGDWTKSVRPRRAHGQRERPLARAAAARWTLPTVSGRELELLRGLGRGPLRAAARGAAALRRAAAGGPDRAQRSGKYCGESTAQDPEAGKRPHEAAMGLHAPAPGPGPEDEAREPVPDSTTGASRPAGPAPAAPGRAGTISVACRVRPLLEGEVAKGVQRAPWELTDRSVSLRRGAFGRGASADSRGRPPSAAPDGREALGRSRTELRNADHRRPDGETILDTVFGEAATTRDVYEKSFKGIVASAAEGLNGAILAYGQTASGKTYSISGATARPAGLGEDADVEPQKGIIHFALDDLFTLIREQATSYTGAGRGPEFLVRMSYAELYMERCNDLLRKISPQTQNLPLKEDPETRSFYVEGLKEKIVSSSEEVVALLTQAEKRRRVAHTRYNEVSSRSHTILTLCIERSAPLEDGPEQDGAGEEEARITQIGRLVIVDLAGNERMEMGTEYMQESNSINTSLFFLGKVIEKLSAQARQDAEAPAAHLPIRDSKLTRLLSVHLGGNSQTGILVTMTPAEDAVDQSMSTLRFAQKAGQVRCSARPVLVSKEQSLILRQREIIAQLQKQVEAMKEEAQGQLEHAAAAPPRPPRGAEEEGGAPRGEDDGGGELAAERRQRAEQVQALTVGAAGPGQQTIVSRSREVDAVVTALHRNNDALRKQKATVLDEIKRMYEAVTDATKRAGRAAFELKPGGGGLAAAAEALCAGAPGQGQGSAWAPALEELRGQMQSLVRLAHTRGQADADREFADKLRTLEGENSALRQALRASEGPAAEDGPAGGGGDQGKPDLQAAASSGSEEVALRQLREENSQLRSSVQFLAGERKRLKAEAKKLQQALEAGRQAILAGGSGATGSEARGQTRRPSDDASASKLPPCTDQKLGVAAGASGQDVVAQLVDMEEPEVEKSAEWSDSWGEADRPEPPLQPAAPLEAEPPEQRKESRGTDPEQQEAEVLSLSGTLGDFEPIVENLRCAAPAGAAAGDGLGLRPSASSSGLGDFEPIVEKNVPPTPPAPVRRPPSPSRSHGATAGLSPARYRPVGGVAERPVRAGDAVTWRGQQCRVVKVRGPPGPRRVAHAPRLGDHHGRRPAGAHGGRAMGQRARRPAASGALAAAAAHAGREAGRAVPRPPGRGPAALRPRPLHLPAGASGVAAAAAAAGGQARQHADAEILQPEPFADVPPAPAGILSSLACTVQGNSGYARTRHCEAQTATFAFAPRPGWVTTLVPSPPLLLRHESCV
ncbi:unnamed protein product [Prorocentrum cordatum]|uniref:Kinesin motor domain-containing protein n=1 Tax=Prorocentrum cordatum TaxID=2364126 RepID=A0ABN9QUR3_9DINO|nr:unnamed protein product [Polarella glacialis]